MVDHVIDLGIMYVIIRGTIYDQSWYDLSDGMWYDHVINRDI